MAYAFEASSIKDTVTSALVPVLDCSLWKKPAAMSSGHTSSPIKGPCGTEPRPPANSHERSHLACGPPAPIKPSDDSSPVQHLETLSQNNPAQVLPLMGPIAQQQMQKNSPLNFPYLPGTEHGESAATPPPPPSSWSPVREALTLGTRTFPKKLCKQASSEPSIL